MLLEQFTGYGSNRMVRHAAQSRPVRCRYLVAIHQCVHQLAFVHEAQAEEVRDQFAAKKLLGSACISKLPLADAGPFAERVEQLFQDTPPPRGRTPGKIPQ